MSLVVGVEIFLAASGEQGWARTEGSRRGFPGNFVMPFRRGEAQAVVFSGGD